MAAPEASPAISSAPALRLRGTILHVSPFRIRRIGQIYVSESELEIDLAAVGDGIYRVLAVHNFHVEDRNPNLEECLAGVFLARRRRDGAWEEPERFPVECRALDVLGVIDVSRGGCRLLAMSHE